MGRAAAERFTELGMRVCAVDIVADSLDTLSAATGCLGVQADVSDPEQMAAAASTCRSALGDIDLAFLNAGIPSYMTVSTFDAATYRKVTGVNIDGVVYGIDAVSRAMRSRRDGRTGGTIVLTASAAGLRPFAGDPYYTLTKAALVGFARAIAAPLAADSIALHTLCPGLTDTGFVTGPVREMLEQANAPFIPAAAIADAVLDVWARPLDTAGTVWLIEDPDHLEPTPYPFHDLRSNEASQQMTSILKADVRFFFTSSRGSIT